MVGKLFRSTDFDIKSIVQDSDDAPAVPILTIIPLEGFTSIHGMAGVGTNKVRMLLSAYIPE